MLHKLFLLLAFLSCVRAYPTAIVDIDWDSVPNATSAARNLNSPYFGECVCDTTWGVCDPFCCCDGDCDAATISTFAYCLPESFSAPDLDYCYPKDQATALHKINNIDARYIDKKKQGYNAVCVIRANHPSELYRYFRVPTEVQQPAIPAASSPVVAANQTYNVGSPLLFAKLTTVDASNVYRHAAAFQIPSALSDGSCSTVGRAVRFLDAVQGVSCTLNGAQICSVLPTTTYTNYFVQSIEWYNASDPAFVPVTVNIFDTSNALLATLDPTDTTATSTYLSYADATTCYNAIRKVMATFTYSSSATGTISGAVLDITVADIPLINYASLTFESAFVAENKTVPVNLIAGTPGYLPGQKVRAGRLVTDGAKSAILERESGFAVPSGGRLCSSPQWKRAGFLYSVKSSGCVISTTEAELQALCTSGTGSLLSTLLNGTVDGVATAFEQVAVTNDALTNDTTSWIAIDGLSSALTSVAGTYDEYNRACSNLVIGVHYQFVIARAGAEYNAQDIIVGAFASPITGTWAIRNQTVFDTSATSLHRLVFRASFSRYDPNSQATIMRRVVAPPILPRLDDTIFYPFRSPYPL